MQNGAFASALAGIVPEKLANVAVTTNAEPKRPSVCIETSPWIFLAGMLPARSLAYLVFKSCRKLA
jgi:hypothetical protein